MERTRVRMAEFSCVRESGIALLSCCALSLRIGAPLGARGERFGLHAQGKRLTEVVRRRRFGKALISRRDHKSA